MPIIQGLLGGSATQLIPVRVDPMGNICTVPGPYGGVPYTKFLTAAGDGTGSDNLNGNYSAAATDFYFAPGVGFDFDVYSLVIQISDNAAFNQIDYGAIGSGLTNGVAFFVNGGAGDIPLLSGKIVKQNNDWYRITSNVVLSTFVGTPQTMGVDLQMQQHFGLPLVLPSGTKFIVRLHDDLSGLVYHSFCLRGCLRPSLPLVQHYWTNQE